MVRMRRSSQMLSADGTDTTEQAGRSDAAFFRMRGRLDDILARGVVTAADGSKKMRVVQVRLLADEVRDDLEPVEPYGFTSEPMNDGAPEAFSIFSRNSQTRMPGLSQVDRRILSFDRRPLPLSSPPVPPGTGRMPPIEPHAPCFPKASRPSVFFSSLTSS